MLKGAVIFFIISLVAGFLGFTDIAAGVRTVAKILFFIFFAIFLIILIFRDAGNAGVLVFQMPTV